MGGQSDGGACVDSRYNIARGTSFPSNGNYVKSLIVDDHGLFRAGLRMLLATRRPKH